MTARGIAQEVVSWYLSQVDDLSPHDDNVQHFLRGPVTALTISILQAEPETEAPTETAPVEASTNGGTKGPKVIATGVVSNGSANGHGNGHASAAPVEEKAPTGVAWRKYLTKGKIIYKDSLTAMSQVDPKAYEKLSARGKARLESFLTGVALAIRSEDFVKPGAEKKQADSTRGSLYLPDGLEGFRGLDKGLVRPQPVGLLRSISGAQKKKKPQIEEDDLMLRLELYIRCLYRVKSQGQDCVVAAEPVRAIKARANMIVVAFIETVGTVRQQSPVLFRLLTTMTMELLAVEYLSEALINVIRRIVSDYEHSTSFASLAFLSSPEQSADQRLTPIMLKYLRYLQSNWKTLEIECDLERLLTLSLDPVMRQTIKTGEFASIGHLLQVCQSFRPQLQAIDLAPTSLAQIGSEQALNDNQALRQAIRDLQREVITVNGNILPAVTSRNDLIELLTQTLNSRNLPILPTRSRRRSGSRRSKSKRSVTSGLTDSDDQSGFDGDNSESSLTLDSSEQSAVPTRSEGVPRRRSFRLSTVNLLTRRLLLAAGRTGTGGDGYFVVRDLFGGEDVAVVPSSQHTMPRRGEGGAAGSTTKGTIEILVKTYSVTIRVHASYDVYPKSMVGDVEPLIQLHTTTNETIALKEVPAENGEATKAIADGEDPPMVLQERITDKTGRRTLAIRPALYETVPVWNTPS